METALCLVLVVLAASAAALGAEPAPAVRVLFGDRQGPLEIDRFALGQGGLSDDPMWDDRVAEVRALRPRVIRLFIQEYFDLAPERERYHFDTLDRSVDTILRAGAKPLMCICFKPRVLFPKVDHDIVEPNEYAAWERLIEALVRHCKDRGAGIRYWEVANEPDIGESGGCPYRFQPEAYTRYYQHTAAAVRRADPGARVGGPALAYVGSPILPALLEFCAAGKAPLDFISWHIYSSDPKAIRGTIETAKGLLAKYPALKAETFLDEWNMDLGLPPRDPRLQPCFVAEVAWQMKDAGLDWSCYYHIRDYHVRPEQFAPFMSPGGNAFMTRWWDRKSQFDGLFDFQNTVRPTYFVFKLLSRLTGERLRLESSHASVHGFATHDAALGVYSLMLWNYSGTPVAVDVALEGLPRDVTAVPLVLDATTPSPDENARLRPEDMFEVKRDKARLRLRLEPYDVRFWTLEPK
jgi:hypothetical protein